MLQPVGKADDFEGIFCMIAALAFGERGEEQGQFHIPLGVEDGHEIVELENEAHVLGPPCGQGAFRELVNALAAYFYGALGWTVEAADEVQQGRLARTGRTHEGKEFALGDGKVQ